MKDYHKLKYDMDEWYIKACRYAKRNYTNLSSKYLLLDMSTLYDRRHYYDLISANMQIEYLDIVEMPNTKRDCEHIILHDKISYNYIDLATPILYFVDTFTSLYNNSLWYSLRNITKDLVVDRHGNIIPVTEIANDSY